MATTLQIQDLIARKGESLHLEVLTGDVGLDRPINVPEVSSPGLVLAGFTDRFSGERLQVLGETEVSYLHSLSPKNLDHAIDVLLASNLPCILVTKGLELPDSLVEEAAKRKIPVIRSNLSTAEFYRRLTPYLVEVFAPTTTVHGSLADVYGVGLLFTGRSGIGKSECVLDLVERGHRLVADDVVHISQRGADILIGRADELSYRYMEIRGVGLVDILALFGVRAVRQQKRIEVVVKLADWESAQDLDRTGLETDTTSILGVELPLVTVPLNPGKNITVISEVVAMNHLLRYSGINAAKAFNDRLIEKMVKKSDLREYLSEDYE